MTAPTQPLVIRPKPVVLTLQIIGSMVALAIIGCVVFGVLSAAESRLRFVLLFPFLMLSAASLVQTALHFQSISYEIDDRHVVGSEGVFWKTRRTTPLDKVTNIDVHQGPFGRALDFGDVWVFTPSTGALMPEQKLVGIERPHEIKKMIVDHAEVLRQGPRGAPEAETTSAASILEALEGIAATLRKIEAKLK